LTERLWETDAARQYSRGGRRGFRGKKH